MNKILSFLQSKRIILIVLIAGLLVGFFLGMEYKSYQIRKNLQTLQESLSQTFSDSSNKEVDKTTANANNGCPNITKEPAEYNFEYFSSSAGYKQLYLKSSFISDMSFSDNFELQYKETYMSDGESFGCNKGSEQGQSINKLYCNDVGIFSPTLGRKNIDKDGVVVNIEKRDIEYFIFDITNKDLNRVSDLKSLKLEAMTCK